MERIIGTGAPSSSGEGVAGGALKIFGRFL
jgi:hypothetical protein